MTKHATHFVGFRGDEFSSAVRVFGRPDFYHFVYDSRVAGDVAPGDTVVFANGFDSKFHDRTFNDSHFHFGDGAKKD
jgi:hypothetical protein